jgi:hypothetical protein
MKTTAKLIAWSHSVCVARRAKGLTNLGTCLPVLPALQSLPPHSQSIGRLYTAGSPFSAHPHRPRGDTSDVSGLHILPNCSRPFHPLARGSLHPEYHSRYRGTRTTDWLELGPAYRRLAITELLQGTTPTLALAIPQRQELRSPSSRRSRFPTKAFFRDNNIVVITSSG